MKAMLVEKMSDKILKEIEAHLAELKEFSVKKAPEVGRMSEMLMT